MARLDLPNQANDQKKVLFFWRWTKHGKYVIPKCALGLDLQKENPIVWAKSVSSLSKFQMIRYQWGGLI